jgi:hypothetical protein
LRIMVEQAFQSCQGLFSATCSGPSDNGARPQVAYLKKRASPDSRPF